MVEEIVLERPDLNESLELSMTRTPFYILDSCSWGEVENDVSTAKYVGQVGKFVSSSTMETRDIKITGWVVSDYNNMTDLKRFLNSFVDPTKKLVLRYAGKYLTFIPDSSVEYATKYEDNNDVIAKFTIKGTSYDPLFKDDSYSNVIIATTKKMLHFPLKFHRVPKDNPKVVFGAETSNNIFEIVNSGDVEAGFRIIFTSRGNVVNPWIKNIKTQERLKINVSLDLGESLTVNTETGNRWVRSGYNDEDGDSLFKYRDISSSWLKLPVGSTSFSFGADRGGSNVNVNILFSNMYLEVQECY